MSGVTECSHVEARGHPVLKAASLVIRAKTRSPTCLQTSFSHFSRVQVLAHTPHSQVGGVRKRKTSRFFAETSALASCFIWEDKITVLFPSL